MQSSDAVLCDVLVVGSGAGGLSAAVTAAANGLNVIVVEKEPLLGGTTAISAGGFWIPANHISAQAGFADTVEDARTYIRHEAGNNYDSDRVDEYLRNGPEMVEFLERRFGFEFTIWAYLPDYHPDSPGATRGGRPLSAAPIDARAFKPWVSQLRPPLVETTIFGGLPLRFDNFEMKHFLSVTRSITSAWYVTRRLLRYFRDRLVHGRNMYMVNGGALTARLIKAAGELNIPIWRSSPAIALLTHDGLVTGAAINKQGSEVRIIARRGVVLAAGGFPHDVERRKRMYPHAAGKDEHFPLAPSGNTGDGLRLAETVGGGVDGRYASPAAWFTGSLLPLSNGESRTVPNSSDRAKPGAIAITREGRRFTNESNSYHDVMEQLVKTASDEQPVHGFVICDHRAIRSYGLGVARPFPLPLGPYLRSGYIQRADTIEALARQIDIDPAVLAASVRNFNEHARNGVDPEFNRGTNAYNWSQGDLNHKPNASLAPLDTPPFYAVKLVPSDLGTFAGLKTDRYARVLGEDGAPIAGLYAVGNDMGSVFGGTYLAGGCTLGPALTFGYISGKHIAGNT